MPVRPCGQAGIGRNQQDLSGPDGGAIQPVYLAQRGHGGSVALCDDAERFPVCNRMPVANEHVFSRGRGTVPGAVRNQQGPARPDGGALEPVRPAQCGHGGSVALVR